MHAATLKAVPGTIEYDAELAAAVERYTEQLAAATQALYERHRGTLPGWQGRPLRIH